MEVGSSGWRPTIQSLKIYQRILGILDWVKNIRSLIISYQRKTPQLDPIKREKIFVDFLESLSEEESKVVLMIKDQKFKYKGITRKLLMECIPEIFNGEELGKSNG